MKRPARETFFVRWGTRRNTRSALRIQFTAGVPLGGAGVTQMRDGSGEAFQFERLEIHHILAELARRAQHEFLLAGGGDIQHPGVE